MIILIIVLLIVAGTAIYAIVIECDGLREKVVTGGIFGLFGLLLFLLGGTLAVAVGDILPDNAKIFEKTGEQYIVALKDSQNVNGKMFILGGNVNADLYYYYAKETDYGLKTSKKEASQCYVVYTDEQPKIETYSVMEFNRWYYYIFAIPMDDYYVFYVPEGTVTTEFNIDLE